MKKMLLSVLLAFSLGAAAQKAKTPVVQFINPKAAPPIGGFTNTAEIDLGTCRMIIIAGQTSFDSLGNVYAPNDFEKQADYIFRLLKAYIEEAGGKMEHIVKLTNYFTNMDDLTTFIRVRNKYVNTKKPPTAVCVQVGKLFVDGLVLEVEATVVIPKK